MTQFAYVNGEFVPRENAKVSAFDRSFLYGDGLFETVRAYAGAPFMLAEHLHRMADSAAELGIGMPNSAAIAGAVARLIELNGLNDAYVRITLSRGVHTGELAPAEPPEPTIVIDARELRPYPPAMYEEGASVIVSSLKHDSASPIRRHKTTSYIASILARIEAKKLGADEAILLDAAGTVAEGATSNVFCVMDDKLLTPPLELNILPGITRRVVIQLARDAGLDVRETALGLPELQSADEAFLTNSLMEILPVRSIEASGGRFETCPYRNVPGALTRTLAQAYRQLVARG